MPTQRAAADEAGPIDPSKVVVVGRSLGGAVAIALCAELGRRRRKQQENEEGGRLAGEGGVPHGPAGLVVENSFTSISDMVSDVIFTSHRRHVARGVREKKS